LSTFKPEEDVLVMKTDIFEDNMFVDADTLSDVDAEETKNLSSLVQQLNGVTSKIEKCEENLKTLKKEKQRLSMETIPELMDEMGIERLDVEGATVSLKPFVSASIPTNRRQEAYTWLRENGLDDIIKNDVVLSFNRGEDNVAGSLMGELEERGFHPESKTHIHSMTLKAFVKERVEKGLPIDLDMFGAFVARTADIKRRKS
jgi:hypothetical protein|tara:strand:+ start:225 stop:830 length:606 start_codon:yes stop_codon:yes gene_type:complete